ncbi:MAG: hypothetical protein ACYDA6_00430 [Solirubrobacteraceae bacterium]
MAKSAYNGSRRRTIGVLALAGAFTLPLVAAAPRADALTYGGSPAGICAEEHTSTETIERITKLVEPTEGAVVTRGVSLTFTAQSNPGLPFTFQIASSPALISTPDIDSGPGVQQPAGNIYAFTSTKATATPRTIYWAATFTRTLTDCEGPPASYTTPVRSLTVAEPRSLSLEGEPQVIPEGVSFTARCHGAPGERCEGEALLSASEPASVSHSRGTRLAGTLDAGQMPFSLAAGQTLTLAVSLDEEAWRALSRARRLPVALSADLTATPGSAPTTVVARSLTILALDTRRVAESITAAIRAHHHIRARVRCPDTVIQVKGNNFTCYATGKGGRGRRRHPFRTSFHVEQVNGRGYVLFHS